MTWLRTQDGTLLNLDAVAYVRSVAGEGGMVVKATMRDGGEMLIGHGKGDWHVQQMHHIGLLLKVGELKDEAVAAQIESGWLDRTAATA